MEEYLDPSFWDKKIGKFRSLLFQVLIDCMLLLFFLTLFNIEIKILAIMQKIANEHWLKFKGGFKTKH